MAFGMEAIAGGTDLLGLGEMGIGNTTIAAAIYAALYGGDGGRLVGRGTGVDDAGPEAQDRRRRARWLHAAHLDDPLEVLRRLGGREIAAIAGAILAARISGSGGARRLCGHGRGGGPACARSRRRSTIASPGTSRPRARTARCWSGSASGRCSISACASAKARRRAGGGPRQGGRRLPRRHGDLRPGRRPTRPDRRAGGLIRPRRGRAARGAWAGSGLQAGLVHRGERVHDAARREGGDHLRALAQLGVQLEVAAMHVRSGPCTIGRPRPVPCSARLDGERALAEGGQHDRDLLLAECPARCRGR